MRTPLKQFIQHKNLLELCNQDFMIHSKLKSDKESWSTFDLSELFPSTPIECTEKSICETTSGSTANASATTNELKFHNNHFDNTDKTNNIYEKMLQTHESFPINKINVNASKLINLEGKGSLDDSLLCENNCEGVNELTEMKVRIQFTQSDINKSITINNNIILYFSMK